MEGNTLFLHIMLLKSQFEDFLNEFLRVLSQNGIVMPESYFYDIDFDTKDSFGWFENVLSTEKFKDNRFKHGLRLSIRAKSDPKLKDDELRWFKCSISIATCDLAKDEKNDDYLMSHFEYSEKAKDFVTKLSEDLFKTFPDSYVSFTNEYNDCDLCEFIERYDEKESETFDDFEMVIVPKTKLGNSFTTDGTIIDNGDHRVLIGKMFE